jgi:hypothetical protein
VQHNQTPGALQTAILLRGAVAWTAAAGDILELVYDGAAYVEVARHEADGNTNKTIASGVITVTRSKHVVSTEAAAASDDLDTINGGHAGMIVVLAAQNDARTVVCKDGTGNLRLNGDFSIDSTADTITLVYDGSNWLELARSDNAA